MTEKILIERKIQWIRGLLTSQAPRLQDQPVLGDHLHILAAQRLPQPHLNLQLPSCGLSSIQNL